MSDKEARVLGIGDEEKIGDKEWKIAPLTIKQLLEVQKAALKSYKRKFLETFAENADLLGPEAGPTLLRQKMEEASKWDVGNLPHRYAYDVLNVDINEQLVALLEQEYGNLPVSKLVRMAVLGTALDSGKILPDTVERLTKTKPRRVQIPYDSWWVTSEYDGMVTFALASLRINHPEVSRETIEGWPLSVLMSMARKIERLTAPAMGNT